MDDRWRGIDRSSRWKPTASLSSDVDLHSRFHHAAKAEISPSAMLQSPCHRWFVSITVSLLSLPLSLSLPLDTPICGLRPLDRSSPALMSALTEILRIIVDGVRKEQIDEITMIFYKKNNLNTVERHLRGRSMSCLVCI